MKTFLLKFIILALILIGFPLGGVFLAGLPVSRYLEFPPLSQYVSHAPFSWPVFSAYFIFIFAVTIPLILPFLSKRKIFGMGQAGW